MQLKGIFDSSAVAWCYGVSRSVELEQSLAVVMVNTGDGPATILKYYTKLPEVVLRRFVEGKPVIPRAKL